MHDIATKFEYQGRSLTVVTVDGIPWFKLKEVCNWLEIGNTTDAKNRLDEDEHRLLKKGDPEFDTLDSIEGIQGRVQALIIINESGLYTLIMSSRSATKKGTIQNKFRKWVTSEVLPAIRQTGKYEVTTPTTQTIIDPITGQTRKMATYDPPITRGELVDIIKQMTPSLAKEFMDENKLEEQFEKFIIRKMKNVLKVLTNEVEEVKSTALNAEENVSIMRETIRELKKTDARQDIVLRRLTEEVTQLRAAQEKTDRQVSVFKKQFTAVKEDIYKRLDVHRNRLNIHKKQIADFKETLGLNFEKVRRQFKGKKPH